MAKMSIKIDIDTLAKEIKVTDDAGNDRTLSGITIVGGDPESGQFYLFSEGNSAATGWALAKGYKWSIMTDHPAGPFYKRMYMHFLQWVAAFHGWTMGTEITGKQLLEKWTQEDLAIAIEEGKTSKFN